jgi:hypothetical protein
MKHNRLGRYKLTRIESLTRTLLLGNGWTSGTSKHRMYSVNNLVNMYIDSAASVGSAEMAQNEQSAKTDVVNVSLSSKDTG